MWCVLHCISVAAEETNERGLSSLVEKTASEELVPETELLDSIKKELECCWKAPFTRGVSTDLEGWRCGEKGSFKHIEELVGTQALWGGCYWISNKSWVEWQGPWK